MSVTTMQQALSHLETEDPAVQAMVCQSITQGIEEDFEITPQTIFDLIDESGRILLYGIDA
jgi:hypothetical protein